MKQKTKTKNLFIILTYCIIYSVIAIEGVLFLPEGQELGFVILDLYIILPVVSFVCSLLFGINAESKAKWIVPIMLAALGCILPAMVFTKESFDMVNLYFSGIPSLLGIVIGSLIHASLKKSVA